MIAYAELVDIIMQNVSWVDSHDLAKTDGVLDCFRHVISDSVCSRTGKQCNSCITNFYILCWHSSCLHL